MQIDVTFFAFAVPAVLFAGLSKGGFGSGAAFAAAPLLALVVDPAKAVGLMLPLLMLMDVTGLRTYWRRWSWPHARRLMIGAIPGVILGAGFFRMVSEDGVRLLVGSVAIGFVAFRIAREGGWIRFGATPPGPFWGYFWGNFAGFTSFVSHAGGPPASMYLLGSRLDKTTYQATTVLVFWWVNLIKFPPYLAIGMFSADMARVDLMLAPVAVIAVLIGVRAHHWIAEKSFFRLTYALLLITGGKLMFDALA